MANTLGYIRQHNAEKGQDKMNDFERLAGGSAELNDMQERSHGILPMDGDTAADWMRRIIVIMYVQVAAADIGNWGVGATKDKSLNGAVYYHTREDFSPKFEAICEYMSRFFSVEQQENLLSMSEVARRQTMKAVKVHARLVEENLRHQLAEAIASEGVV